MMPMRRLLPFFLFAIFAPAYGQAPTTPADYTRAEFLDQKFWSTLGKPVEGSRGFSLFTRNMQPKTDSLFEVWVKIMPNNAVAFNRRYGLPSHSAFVIQHATVDCSGRTVKLERTAAYDLASGAVDSRSSDLVKNESRTRVRSGSVSDTIFQYICLKLPNQ
jgi:hypothetical protein